MISNFASKSEECKNRRNGLKNNSKPLENHKFYLDVRNHQTSLALEAKIKEFGGLFELFLTKEVTHVITDRNIWCNSRGVVNVPTTPQICPNDSCNGSPSTLGINSGKSRPKTRTDAMLERARQQSHVATKDPLQQAKSWGITICSVDKIFTWLEKIANSVKIAQEKKKTNNKQSVLKAPYIKFEAFDRKARPVFQEIPNWPVLNTTGNRGEPAFIYRSANERNMTRKTRANHARLDAALQPGYCEICRTEYSRLDKHLESDSHRSFAKDDNNYIELDNLIDTGSGIETFLKLHGVQLESELTNGKMPKTRGMSLLRDKIQHSIFRIKETDNGHRLRSKKQTSNTENIAKLNSRELRSHSRLPVSIKSEGNGLWASGRPKRTCIKPKRISADERLVYDNKTYYKVELLTSKLRSSGNCKRQSEKRVQTIIPDEDEDEDEEEDDEDDDETGVVVKFRRLRSSELIRLNNEAESFLFPEKDDSTSDEDIDDNCPNTTISSKKGDSSFLLSSEVDRKCKLKNDLDEDVSMDSNYSEASSSSRKKKRRTHAEAFITDNEKYYKFETPGSRLRYQGSYLPQIANKLAKSNGEYKSTAKIKQTDETKNENKFKLSEIQFSFERVPKSEPWYLPFQRQDCGEEYYTCFSDSGYWKPFLLPYEMGAVSPLDPKVCISAYSQTKKDLSENSSASTSVGCSTPDCTSTAEKEGEDSKSSDDTKTNYDSKIEEETNEINKISESKISHSKRGRKRKLIFSSSKNPRKSPRQHASTLAILSSLLHQRKRNRSKNFDQSATRHTLPSVQENINETYTELETDYDELAKDIDSMLASPVDNKLRELEISIGDISLHYEPSVIDALAEYERFKDRDNVEVLCNSAKSIVPKNTSGKKSGRKKKKNRTGWPNKNRRILLRKGIKEEEIVGTEFESSAVYSPSIIADSEDNDENCDDDNSRTNGFMGYENNVNAEKLSISKDGNVNENSISRGQQNLKDVLKGSELNGDIQTVKLKLNDANDNCELNNKTDCVQVNRVVAANRKERRGSSSDSCAEIVIASVVDNVDCVNVDLDKWETAEKVLAAKLTNTDSLRDVQFQPIVRVQKLDNSVDLSSHRKRTRNNSSPPTTIKRPRRMPASPKSPKMLRKPRGRWYRER